MMTEQKNFLIYNTVISILETTAGSRHCGLDPQSPEERRDAA
jgi:hypothetical protein